MNRVWYVLKREYLENVRTRAFLIGLILTPVWMGLIFLVPKLVTQQKGDLKKVVIVDATGVLGETLAAQLREAGGYDVRVEPADAAWDADEDGYTPVDELRIAAGAGELFAVILTPPVLEKREPRSDEHASQVVGANRSTDDAFRGPAIARMVDELVNERVMEARGIDPEDAALLSKAAVSYTPLTATGEAGTPAFAILPLVFMMLLFMGIVGISQMLVNSTLEEKANRVYELLLSSVSPTQLMTGKVLGICGVGFTLLLIWSGGGLIAASAQGLTDIVTGGQIGWFLVYYVLGFLLIASLMVAIGSACNTLKEAQNLMAPISLFLAMPVILSMVIMRNPNGEFAEGLSFFPPFTPFVMMARISSVPPPPEWQKWASLLLLIVATWFAIRFAARVFRVGILMYGQPPKLKEIVRWMFARY